MKQMKAEPESDELFEQPLTDDPMVGVEQPEMESSESGFPQEYMEPLRGLLFLGRLNKTFMYAGHEFLIHTLTEGEVLRVGQLMSPYRDTMAEVEARKCYIVAACVEAVDGYAVFTEIEPTPDSLAQRVQTVKQWYPPVVDYVYRRYVELEKTEFSVASSLKK